MSKRVQFTDEERALILHALRIATEDGSIFRNEPEDDALKLKLLDSIYEKFGHKQ
jgi:hypothetical protein